MMKKAIGIIVVLFLQFNIVFAQSSFEVEGVYSFTSEKLLRSNNKFYRYKPHQFHSFGINGKKYFNQMFLFKADYI